MTLSACAKYDFENKLKYKLTGWGKICLDREARGISRKAMRLKKKENK